MLLEAVRRDVLRNVDFRQRGHQPRFAGRLVAAAAPAPVTRGGTVGSEWAAAAVEAYQSRCRGRHPCAAVVVFVVFRRDASNGARDAYCRCAPCWERGSDAGGACAPSTTRANTRSDARGGTGAGLSLVVAREYEATLDPIKASAGDHGEVQDMTCARRLDLDSISAFGTGGAEMSKTFEIVELRMSLRAVNSGRPDRRLSAGPKFVNVIAFKFGDF